MSDSTFQELKAARDATAEKLQTLCDTVEAKGCEWSDDDNAEEKRLTAELSFWQARIDRLAEGGGGTRGSSGRTGTGDNGGFDSLGAFLSALATKARGDGLDPRLQPLQALPAVGPTRLSAQQQVGLPSAGGFFVPALYADRIFGPDPADDTVLLNLADRIDFGNPPGDTVRVPLFQDDSHSGTNPYGVTWAPVGESASFGTAQRLTARQLELNLKKHGALFSASNEWLSDAMPAARQRLEVAFVRSLRWYIERQLIRGTGGGTCLGVLSSPCLYTQPGEIGQLSATIIFENIAKMWSALMPGSHPRAIWIASAGAFQQIMGLTIVGGTAATAVYVPSTGAAESPYGTLLGRPVYISEHASAVGSTGDLILADPSYYLIASRGDAIVDASQHANFATDETVFRAKFRIDGQPALSSTFTAADGTTRSPFVVIADR